MPWGTTFILGQTESESLRVVAFLLIWAVNTAAAAAVTLTGEAEVVDGDTMKIGPIVVRLYGIDAPEGRQTCERDGGTYPCGAEATQALAALISRRPVQCEVVEQDRYHRVLGVCTVDGTELNTAMVRSGWAVAFRKYSKLYAIQEAEAYASKAGVWAGSFVKPWEWRVRQVQAAQQHPGDCVIKGNINSSGERIYHLPFQQAYPRTNVDEDSGERWFCTEQEANEAGWRRALQ